MLNTVIDLQEPYVHTAIVSKRLWVTGEDRDGNPPIWMYPKLLINIQGLCPYCNPLHEKASDCVFCRGDVIIDLGVWRMGLGPFPIEKRQWPQKASIEKITVHGPWVNPGYKPRILHWKPGSDMGICLNTSFSVAHDINNLENLIGQWACLMKKVCN